MDAEAIAGEPSPPPVLNVLAVEDCEGDARILREQVEQLQGYRVRFLHARDTAAAREALRGDVDLIFLDYALGPDTGDEFLRKLRAAGELRPVIALTIWNDPEVVAALMRSGADDYLLKGVFDPDQLQRSIVNAQAQYRRRESERHNRELLGALQIAKTRLETQNRTLSELYDTAHQFVDHVSHEFRTPLTVIREFAAILRDGIAGTVTTEQCDYLSIIVNRVDDLSVLVDDMLDISKLEAGELGIDRHDCPVTEILDRVQPTLVRRALAAGAELTFEIPADLPTVYCDSEKASRTLTNLVINALKFCGSPGRVRVAARRDGDAVRIEIEDNGDGIPTDELQTLFERFRQFEANCRRGMKGFGLGLSIAKGLVHLNFGEIVVESTVGRGSTFAFTVPTATRPTLLRRYVERVPALREGTTHVALVHVRTGPSDRPGAAEQCEQLLLQQTRRGDLLFRPAPDQWLLVLALCDDDPQPVCQRIEQAWTKVGRQRPRNPLPALTLRTEGVCPLIQPEELIETFLRVEHSIGEEACENCVASR